MKLMWAVALAVAAAGAAQAQTSEQSPYCAFLQNRIQQMRTSLAGLQSLVSTQGFTLLQCTPDVESEDGWYACLDNPGAQGMWRDAETRIVYIVYTKDFVRNLAAERGLTSADVQRSFSMADNVRNKIAYGGVLDSLQYEIKSWEESYRNECGAQTQPDNAWDGCLLGVCPPVTN